MKNGKLVVNTISIFLCLFMLFSTVSQANNIDGWISEGNNFIEKGSQTEVIDTGEIKNVVLPIGQALVAIGTVVLVVITVIMGIKYMMCQSADEKAKLKTQLIGLVVSTIVIFGAQVIWSVLYEFMTNVTK